MPEAVDASAARRRDLHLLGVTRSDHVSDFARYGVTSFDSTSPFRQAFKDDTDNYYTLDRNYIALRVPQVDGNANSSAGSSPAQSTRTKARRLERACLRRSRRLRRRRGDRSRQRLDALDAYERTCSASRDSEATYAETLEAAPWKHCPCAVCEDVGIDVVIFRGAERNKRRGFHNLFVFASGSTRARDAADGARRLGDIA